MPGNPFKTNARKLIVENTSKVLLASIVFVLITTVLSQLQYHLLGFETAAESYLERLREGQQPNISMLYSSFKPSGVALVVVLRLLISVFDAGLISYCLKLTRGHECDYKDVFNGFFYLSKVVTITVITSVLIMLWSLLFLFPGIAAAYRYRKALYILYDDPKKSALQCIRESKLIMHGNKLDLFLLDLSFVGWIILDILAAAFMPLPIPVPFIAVWLSPYQGLSRASFYNNLIDKLAV